MINQYYQLKIGSRPDPYTIDSNTTFDEPIEELYWNIYPPISKQIDNVSRKKGSISINITPSQRIYVNSSPR